MLQASCILVLRRKRSRWFTHMNKTLTIVSRSNHFRFNSNTRHTCTCAHLPYICTFIPEDSQHSGSGKHVTAHFALNAWASCTKVLRAWEKIPTTAQNFPFDSDWGEKRATQEKHHHTFAHQQQSETRTKKRMSPKTAHTVITLMGLHEVAFILQVASWRLQSSSTERTEPFNHSHRDWFTKLAFLWWGTVIYLCAKHAGTRRSCMSNPSLTLCTSGTE